MSDVCLNSLIGVIWPVRSSHQCQVSSLADFGHGLTWSDLQSKELVKHELKAVVIVAAAAV